jgi:E3 ubiquitin-protein ligase RBBP6
LEERKKEKRIKEKKKKKDSEDKEKKKKKKKEKKALIQKEAAAAVAAAAAAAVVSSTTLPIIKVKEEPPSSDETPSSEVPVKSLKSMGLVQLANIIVKSEPPDETKSAKLEDKKLVSVGMPMNPEPPESKDTGPSAKSGSEPDSQAAAEAKPETKITESSLYAGLVDDAEISTTSALTSSKEDQPREDGEVEVEKPTATSLSPKKEEFLAPLPELSKWEREEGADKLDDSSEATERESSDLEDSKSAKIVTTEVLKRAENAIFQKAINAIRPIEIKKISESRKVLYQNPEPKVRPTYIIPLCSIYRMFQVHE